MADGTYILIKENAGATFDEKTVLAVSGKTLGFDSSLDPVMLDANLEPLIFVCSEFETDLVSDTKVRYLRLPNDKSFTLVGLPRATVAVAPTGSTIEVDVNDDGSSIFSTVITIDATEFSSDDATAPCVLTSTPTVFAAGSVISIDTDQVGGTVTGQELIVTLFGYYTAV